MWRNLPKITTRRRSVLCLELVYSLGTGHTGRYKNDLGATERVRHATRASGIFVPYLFLAGLLLVAVGSCLGSLPPTDNSCISIIWLTNFCYSLELVPLVVKSAALNHSLNAWRRMRRVRLKKESLYGSVI